jgi:hypothetical protein
MGGQVRSDSAGGAPVAGAPGCGAVGSSGLPPNRLLKRSVSDCAAAGETRLDEPIAKASAAMVAILMTRLSPIIMIPDVVRYARYDAAL